MSDTFTDKSRIYWNSIATSYNSVIDITTEDFHYGPLVPGDRKLKLLPEEVNGLCCLELGCGAAQNSIFLAGMGARCTALDISQEQLDFASELADNRGVRVDLVCSAMEDVDAVTEGCFDIVHSSYAISFSENPALVIKKAYSLVASGGLFIFSTGHPLCAGEWLEVGSEGEGLFLKSYFELEADVRLDAEGDEVVRSKFYPVGKMANWLIDAGFELLRIEEPMALPSLNGNGATHAPYHSRAWCNLHTKLQHIPVVVIYKCRKI